MLFVSSQLLNIFSIYWSAGSTELRVCLYLGLPSRISVHPTTVFKNSRPLSLCNTLVATNVKISNRNELFLHIFRPNVHKIPARVQCTVQVCELAVSNLHPHHTAAGRSSVSLTQSPFAFPSNCRCGPPLTSYMSGRRFHPVHGTAAHIIAHCGAVLGLCTSVLDSKGRNKLYLYIQAFKRIIAFRYGIR
jgi:hypothetical protein